MAKAPSPQFDGWELVGDHIYQRRVKSFVSHVIVSRVDGISWGWLAFDSEGTCLAGRVSFNFTVFDAVDAAEKRLGLKVPA